MQPHDLRTSQPRHPGLNVFRCQVPRLEHTQPNTYPMRQITTDTRLPAAERNAIVVAAGLPCQALGCQNKATRWSNLCGLCERQFLEDMKPVFGKPSKEQLASAEAVVRDHYADKIASGVFDDWASQIGRTLSRPLAMLPAPLALKRRPYPKQRYDALLALRTRDRGVLTRRGVINLLAFALAVDALITPTIPQPVRNDYMIALLGQRFMRREVYSRTVNRYRSRREKTGVIRYGPNGPEELTRIVEEEVPTKEYCRIRRADLRYVGRRLWKAMEKMLLSGGRKGATWSGKKEKVAIAAHALHGPEKPIQRDDATPAPNQR
ncbi:hypothetical protein ACVWWG_004051 [Bradyrhizobium sp. LB7.2]